MEGQTHFDFSNRLFYTIAILVLGVLVFLAAQMLYHRNVLSQQDQITVSGEGKVYVKPDVATVSLGVRIDGQDIKTITESNVTKVNKIISDLKDLGVEENDIQTTSYAVTPQYNWTQDRGTVPNGYSIEQSLTVKIRDFSKIGNILSKASEDGANTIGSLQFTVDDMDQYREEARSKAIAKARASAENLAKEAGFGLGKIVNVYESSYPSPIMYSKDVAMGMGMGGAEPAMAPTIQPGQNEINITVSITYRVQ